VRQRWLHSMPISKSTAGTAIRSLPCECQSENSHQRRRHPEGNSATTYLFWKRPCVRSSVCSIFSLSDSPAWPPNSSERRLGRPIARRVPGPKAAPVSLDEQLKNAAIGKLSPY
jgi:hypothetical protein